MWPRELGKVTCAGWSFLQRPQRVVTAGVGGFLWTSVGKEAARDPARQSRQLAPWLSPSAPLPLPFLPLFLTLGPFPVSSPLPHPSPPPHSGPPPPV